MKRRVSVLALLLLATLPCFAQYGGRWEILRAEYGSGDRWVDVTASVRSLVSGNTLSFRVTNDALGGDPAPGRPKTLRLRLRDEYGRESVQTFLEKDSVNLTLAAGGALASGGLQILRAEYGAGNRYRDVTARLNARIQGNQFNLRVTNETMGGDPADDLHKSLTVWFVSNGRVAKAVVSEGEYLNMQGNYDYFQGNLYILRAQYGVGSRYLDVTERLNSLIQGDQLSLRVTNDAMGGDPDKDRHKQLTVFYVFNGQQGRLVVQEKDYLSLPAGGSAWSGGAGGLEILEATYGAGDRRRDVTSRLVSQVSGDQLQMLVTNSAMGGDPAEGRPKRLRVIYLWQGLRNHANAAEGETLIIP